MQDIASITLDATSQQAGRPPKISEEAHERVRAMASIPWRSSDRDPDDPIDLKEFLQWYSLVGFREELMLTQEECALRNHARKYGIPVDIVDNTTAYFSAHDTNGDGLLEFDEFSVVVHKLMRIRPPNELSKNRLLHWWAELDKEGSGKVMFEEFLQWWLKHFDANDIENSVMPFESYYQVRNLWPGSQGHIHMDPLIRPVLDAQAKEQLAADAEIPSPTHSRSKNSFIHTRMHSAAVRAQKSLDGSAGGWPDSFPEEEQSQIEDEAGEDARMPQ
jgi:hypothetical protein